MFIVESYGLAVHAEHVQFLHMLRPAPIRTTYKCC